MATKTNAEIAAAFEELGDLYELDGAVSYRVIAYRTAAKAVRDASVSIMALTREGKVTTVPGIGKTLEEKLSALDETGDIPAAVKLRAKFPAGLIAVMHLPGFGPKRARLLYDELGHRLAGGAARGGRGGRDPRAARVRRQGRGEPAAVLAEQRGRRRARAADPAVARAAGGRADRRRAARPPGRRPGRDRRLAAPAGRHRQGHRHHRHRLRPGRADRRRWRSWRSSSRSAAAARRGARVVTHSGMKVDLKVVAPDQFGNVLQHFTGAKAHNVQLREAAVRRGLHVSEYGILDDETGETLRCATEEEVYERLGLRRGSRPSCARAAASSRRRAKGELPELIELEDLRGDLHCHTTLSDGRQTLEEMVEAALRARLGVPRGDRPLGLARVRQPRHARGAGGADRGDRGAQRARSTASRCSPAPSPTSSRTARSTTPTSCSQRAGLGDRLGPHLVRDGRGGDDRADGRRDRAPVARRDRPPDRPQDRDARRRTRST